MGRDGMEWDVTGKWESGFRIFVLEIGDECLS